MLSEDEELELEMELARAAAQAEATKRSEDEFNARVTPVQAEQGAATPPAFTPSGPTPQEDPVLMDRYRLQRLESQQQKITREDEAPVLVGGSLWNAAKETAGTVAGVGEWVGNRINEIENPILRAGATAAHGLVNPAGAVAAAIPGDQAQQIEENLPEYRAKTGVGQMVGEGVQFGAGMLGPAKGINVQTAQGFARVMGAISKYAASMASGASAMDEDTQGLAPEALKVYVGLGKDPEGNYSDELMKKRLSLAAEAFLLEKPMEVGVRAAAAIGKFFWDNIPMKIINWQSMDTREKEVAQDFVYELMDINPMTDTPQDVARKMRSISSDMREGGQRTFESTTPGIDEQTIQRPTAQAYLEGGRPKTDIETARAGGMHAAAENKGGGSLAARVVEPQKTLETSLNQTREAFGDAGSVQAAKDAVLESGEREMKNFTDEVARQKDDIVTSEGSLTNTVKEDDFLGPQLRDAEAGKLDLRKDVNDTVDQMVQEHNQFRDNLKQAGDDAFKKIPRNAKYDEDSLGEVLDEVSDFLPGDVKRILDNSDGTYRYLRDKVGTRLNNHISDMFRKGDSVQARELVKLRNEIYKNQLDLLADRGVNKTVREYANASRKYVEEQVPYQQGASEELYQIHKDKSSKPEKGYFGKPDEASYESRKIVKNTFDDPDKIEQTRRLLSTISTPELKDKYIVGRVAEELSGKSLKDLDVDAFRKVTRPYAQMMDDGGKRLEDLYNTLATQKGNVDEMKKTLDATMKETAKAEDRLYRQELGKFFDKQGLKISDGDDVFASYLSEKNGVNEIKQLKNRIAESGNELAQKGLQSAYAKHFQNNIFRSGRTAGAKNLNETVVKNINEGTDKLLVYGDEIFGKNSSEMKMFRGLIEEAQKNKDLSGAKKIPLRDVNSATTEARSAFDFLITQYFGALNRMGARVRAGMGRVVASNSTTQSQLRAIENFYSDYSRAADKIDELARQYEGKMNPENKNRMIDALVAAGIFEQPPVVEQTKKALPPPEKKKEDQRAENNGGQNKLRPFREGERRENKDGSYSTERLTTWQLPDGQWVNVPSLWMGVNGPVEFAENNEKGILGTMRVYEKSHGQKFPRFKSLEEAEKAARERSKAGGVATGSYE